VRLRPLLLLALVLLPAPIARAQVYLPGPTVADTGRAPVVPDLTVTLVTFGQGREVFERFGHDALWFHDNRTGEDVAYHWGLFDFNEPHFIARFVSGDTRYSMGGMDARALIDYERRSGRTVTLQRLDLTPSQAMALRDFVRWNARDENKYYRYDYFQDNCATRLRDALDRSVGGYIRMATDTVITPLTYRSESVRLTDGDRPVQAGIDMALGRPADRPLTLWQSFFIPMRLRDALRTIKVPGPGGAMRPIVAEERVLPAPAGGQPVEEQASAPRIWPRYLLAGCLFGLLVLGLRVMSESRRSAVWGLALFSAGWYLLCGVLGILIGLAWLATRHVFWAGNENLLLLTPLCLALVVLAPMALLRGRAAGAARLTAMLVAGLGLVALMLALIPGGQDSAAIVALLLPVHLALAWALALPRRAPLPRTVVA
jgi:hypothetical protein